MRKTAKRFTAWLASSRHLGKWINCPLNFCRKCYKNTNKLKFTKVNSGRPAKFYHKRARKSREICKIHNFFTIFSQNSHILLTKSSQLFGRMLSGASQNRTNVRQNKCSLHHSRVLKHFSAVECASERMFALFGSGRPSAPIRNFFINPGPAGRSAHTPNSYNLLHTRSSHRTNVCIQSAHLGTKKGPHTQSLRNRTPNPE